MNKKLTLIPVIALALIALTGSATPAPVVEPTPIVTVHGSGGILADDGHIVTVEGSGGIIAETEITHGQHIVTVEGCGGILCDTVTPDPNELDVLVDDDEGGTV